MKGVIIMNPKQRLEKACDKLFADIVKLRAKGRCQLIGCTLAGVHAHHIARRGGNVRWFIDNGIYLCVFHHDHDYESDMNREIIKAIGISKFKELEAMSWIIRQWKQADLKILKSDLTAILNFYKAKEGL